MTDTQRSPLSPPAALASPPILRDAAHAWQAAQALVADGSARRDPASPDLLATSGLLGASVPQALGGAGLDAAQLVDIVTLLAAVDTALAQELADHFAAWDALSSHADDAQRAQLAARALQGQRLARAVDQPRPATPLPDLLPGLLAAAIELGLGQGAQQALLPFLREHARPWVDAQVERAVDDPLTLHALGRVEVRLHAARALLRRAAGRVEATRGPGQATAESVRAAETALAEARVLTHDAGLLAANQLLELGGTSSTFAAHGFDRYWLDLRRLTLQAPVGRALEDIGREALAQSLRPTPLNAEASA